MGLWRFFWVRVLDDDLEIFFVGFAFWVLLGWRGFCWDFIICVCGFWDAGDVGRVIEPRVGRLVGPVAVHWQGAAEICPRQRYGFVEMSGGKSVSVLGTVASVSEADWWSSAENSQFCLVEEISETFGTFFPSLL